MRRTQSKRTSLRKINAAPATLFVRYVAYSGSAGDHPRSISLGAVAEGRCRIIEVEGPMVAKRAYEIYLRGFPLAEAQALSDKLHTFQGVFAAEPVYAYGGAMRARGFRCSA